MKLSAAENEFILTVGQPLGCLKPAMEKDVVHYST